MRNLAVAMSLLLSAPAVAAECPPLSSKAIAVLKPLMTLRNRQAADEFTPDGRWRGESRVSGEVEKRFYSILSDQSPSGDEAVAYLLTVYMGEHPGEDLVCEATNRGERLLFLVRTYSKCQPKVGAEPLHKFVQGNGIMAIEVIQAIESGTRCNGLEP